MNKNILLIAALLATAACTRVETGEAGVRVGVDKQVSTEELRPGSFNQTLFGDVLIFPVKDVQVEITNMTPLASDNSTVKDFDLGIIYNINPSSVADIYINKSRSFHATDDDGEIYLMYNYVHQVGRNAAYKAARKYESLKMSDNRAQIEQEIRETMAATIAAEGLGNKITISQVLVKSITPADSIVQSANALVRAQNENKQKSVEVATAKLEAERISALNANKGATEYMAAMALMNISEGVKEGKVSTIIVPYDFKGIIQAK